MSWFSFQRQPCRKTHLAVMEKMLVFEKGQIIGIHQGEKTSTEIVET